MALNITYSHIYEMVIAGMKRFGEFSVCSSSLNHRSFSGLLYRQDTVSGMTDVFLILVCELMGQETGHENSV